MKDLQILLFRCVRPRFGTFNLEGEERDSRGILKRNVVRAYFVVSN